MHAHTQVNCSDHAVIMKLHERSTSHLTSHSPPPPSSSTENDLLKLHADSPSEPQNLDSALTSTTNGSVAVRLDWDPPLNDGGVTITNYLIFANISQDVVTANTTITLTLNSTGEYLIEISAVNVCGFTSDKVSWTVNITGNH